MKVNIEIDDNYNEPTITIQTNEWTEELEEILTIIKGKQRKRIFGMEDEQTVLLDPEQIEFIFAEHRKVYVVIGKRRLEDPEKAL